MISNQIGDPIPYTKMEPGEFCPSGAEITTFDECKDALSFATPLGITLGARNNVVGPGNWGHVPIGCSYQATGDQAYHFNQRDGNIGGYRLICKQGIKIISTL